MASLGEAQSIQGTHEAGLAGLDGIILIVNRRGRACEVVDLVALDVQVLYNVMSDELKVIILHEVPDVAFLAGEEVIGAYNVVPLSEELFAEVRADEASSSCNEYSFS